MITTPTSFTRDYLSGLKFKELQKLSVQFHVNKRWAKKQELIDNLLALKGKDKIISDDKQGDGNEWRDGGSIFNDLNFDQNNEVNRRLTFNVSANASGAAKIPQAPTALGQKEEALLCETITSRETYDIPPKKMDLSIEPVADPRATFDVPPKSKLIDGVDPRATFDIPQNGRILLDDNVLDDEIPNFKNFASSQRGKTNIASTDFKEELGKIKFDINLKDDNLTRGGKTKPQVKMLTIPYARVTRRTRKDGEPSKNENTPIKISKKSINIKKLTRPSVNKNDITKSPAFSSVKKSLNKRSIVESFTKPQSGETMRSKLPVRLQFSEKFTTDAISENSKKILGRHIPKASDEVFEKKPNSIGVSSKTVPTSVSKSAKVLSLKKTPLLKDTNGRLNSNTAQTAGDNHTVSTKALTATKMPDFSKIHKKQFDQMDSLHDYIRKKEERIRKLFGTPQPGQQLQVHNKSAPLFRFQSGVPEKDSTDKENLKTPLKRKEHDSMGVKKEAFKSKLPPSKLQSEIKDKNRSHIRGVRTNKRFELQMKLRNM